MTTVWLLRHRQTKGAATDRPGLRTRDARPLLYPGRRGFLRFLLLLGGIVPVRRLFAVPIASEDRRPPYEALAAYLDILLPADLTPSATELGVDKALVAESLVNADLERLLVLGCDWLDQQAQRVGADGFALLDVALQEQMIAAAEQAPRESVPGQFFLIVGNRAFGYYYSHPESWVGLDYAGPPQPLGFPDHAEPPRSASA